MHKQERLLQQVEQEVVQHLVEQEEMELVLQCMVREAQEQTVVREVQCMLADLLDIPLVLLKLCRMQKLHSQLPVVQEQTAQLVCLLEQILVQQGVLLVPVAHQELCMQVDF
jgi:hypothetical protein